MTGSSDRMTLQSPELAHDEAVAAVRAFVDELQRGLDERDAVVYNRHFAADVIWGSPYGQVVRGYETLHAIHQRLLRQRAGGRSRYELVGTLQPSQDVVIAHVRRTGLDEGVAASGDRPRTSAFSEMAMYVLVHREGEWWLAAGQNTVIDSEAGQAR